MDNAARNRGRQAVAYAVAVHACAERPTFIVVEDVHWADPQLLECFSAFASAMAEGPGLLTMTSRVEGDPINAAWRASCRGAPFAIDLALQLHCSSEVSAACGVRLDGFALADHAVLVLPDVGRRAVSCVTDCGLPLAFFPF
jgi:hypothetical protein